MAAAVRIGNIAEAAPDWRWIAPFMPPEPPIDWTFVSAIKRLNWERRVKAPHMGRLRGAAEIRGMAASGALDVVVSHGPFTSLYTSALLGLQRRRVPHVAMSFNFTDLPTGARHRLMARAFRSIDRFAVYAQMERALYRDYFDIPLEKLEFVRWGVDAPIRSPGPRRVGGRYFVAMGGEARDYRTLLDAARAAPGMKIVMIVRPWSLEGLSVPDNVEIHVNLPWEDAWSLVWHAEAALLPLRTATTPNGHVTIVGGMHLDKAHVVTDSIGIRDYASEETALLVPAQDPGAYVRAMERLMDEPALAPRLGAAAGVFARTYCTEAVTADWFSRYIAETGRASDRD